MVLDSNTPLGESIIADIGGKMTIHPNLDSIAHAFYPVMIPYAGPVIIPVGFLILR